MASYTENLSLFCYDPTTSGDYSEHFSIVLALNDNWEKIDAFCENTTAEFAALPDVSALIAAHDADVLAHPALRALLDELERAVDKVNLKYDTEVTGNQFTVLFDDLDDVTVVGVWNAPQARVEFGEVN